MVVDTGASAVVLTQEAAKAVGLPLEVLNYSVNVDTANGIVSLTGVVDSEQERQCAIQLAQGIEGVKHVKTQNLHLRK